MASIFSKKISRRVLRFLFWYSASAKVNWLMIRLAGLKNGRCGYYRKKWGVIQRLPKVILCFGKYTGNFVAEKLGAKDEYCEPWVENNHRRWQATARSSGKTIVVTAPHPSIAAWNVPATDPSEYIGKLLDINIKTE